MTQTHPLTPPEELLEQWYWTGKSGNWQNALTLAYRAGADQELEACCKWVDWKWSGVKSRELRAARRTKQPSLKEQALEALKRQSTRSVPSLVSTNDCDTIRRALEQL